MWLLSIVWIINLEILLVLVFVFVFVMEDGAKHLKLIFVITDLRFYLVNGFICFFLLLKL